MAPIATADGTPSHTANPVLGNSADEVDVPLKLAVAEPEHGSSKLAPPPDGEAKHLEYPRSRVNLVNRFVDEPRKIKVIVIGGGLAGILAGCLLPQKVPGVELVIYEKNPDFVSYRAAIFLSVPRSRIWLSEMNADRFREVLGTRMCTRV